MCTGSGDEARREADAFGPPRPAIAELFVDSHCHPTDDPAAYTSSNLDELSTRIGNVTVERLVCMSTNARDQTMVAKLASLHPDKVVPCFGWHPWFAHQISLRHPAPSKAEHYHDLFSVLTASSMDNDRAKEGLEAVWDQLPDPISIESVCQDIREQFERFPGALLGEVGIDRAFRIPRRAWNYDPQKPDLPVSEPKLTKLKTPQAHQLAVLRAQIDVALQYRRNISLHSVQAAGLTVDLLSSLRNAEPTSFGAIRVSLHSCTLDNNVVKSITKKHPNVYIGFSSTINRKQFLAKECLAAADRSRALMESDYHTVKGIPGYLHQANEYFAQLHGLSLEDAAKQLRSNWETFHSIQCPEDSGSEDTDSEEAAY
ncbi:related to Cut9 interacting protein scn1 [Ustilago sp. UG-2017b]|nr:related to Cut9 interacting protein scn1 [Ustilago sp. UG-2017b]